MVKDTEFRQHFSEPYICFRFSKYVEMSTKHYVLCFHVKYVQKLTDNYIGYDRVYFLEIRTHNIDCLHVKYVEKYTDSFISMFKLTFTQRYI
jgi:hypothetical protein